MYRYLCVLSTFFVVIGCQPEQQVINVYTSRASHLIEPLFKQFEQQSGITINYTTDKAGSLIERLRVEGENTQADLLITVDAGNLWHAANFDLLRPIHNEDLLRNVPEHLRDKKNRWVALSKRARAIIYSADRVRPEELSTYQDLADNKWHGRLCLRTSKKVYNQSLIASFIHHFGVDKTENIVRGWISNLATEPFSSDTKAIKAILAGECDVTVVNSYYFLRLKDQDASYPIALFWPNQSSTGVHINISGGGVIKHARHPKIAEQFLSWLTSVNAQYELAHLNKEIPVNRLAAVSPIVKDSMRDLIREDSMKVSLFGGLQSEAIKLMDRVNYR